jgi:hypothetical protein
VVLLRGDGALTSMNSTSDELTADWAIRRWGLVGGSRSLGGVLLESVSNPWTLPLTLSLSASWLP